MELGRNYQDNPDMDNIIKEILDKDELFQPEPEIV